MAISGRPRTLSLSSDSSPYMNTDDIKTENTNVVSKQSSSLKSTRCEYSYES